MLAAFNNRTVVLTSNCLPNNGQETTVSNVFTTRFYNHVPMFALGPLRHNHDLVKLY